MNSIGGFFELELRKGESYHIDALQLNTGRNALELILRIRNYSKVYIPYYTCDVLLEPFKKMHIEFEFYSIDENLEPIFDTKNIKDDEGFLYTNYFGLKDTFINMFAQSCSNLIVDNAQSFFSKPLPGVPTFFSCRKFFGVPDGSYLYIDGLSDFDLPNDYSSNRLTHLLKRLEFGAEKAYDVFKENENNLVGSPILKMSGLTQKLLSNIDYNNARKIRVDNFNFLDNYLSKYNKLKFQLNDDAVPMVYPFISNQSDLRNKLIQNKIFVPFYWRNVIEWSPEKSMEKFLANNLIPLPIDQRYSKNEMSKIISFLDLR